MFRCGGQLWRAEKRTSGDESWRPFPFNKRRDGVEISICYVVMATLKRRVTPPKTDGGAVGEAGGGGREKGGSYSTFPPSTGIAFTW